MSEESYDKALMCWLHTVDYMIEKKKEAKSGVDIHIWAVLVAVRDDLVEELDNAWEKKNE